MTQTTAVAVTTRSRSSRRSRIRLALLLLALGLLGGCSSCGESPQEGGPDAAVADLPPVPEPEGLLAELVVHKPGETWGKLRELGGGPVRLLPQSFALLLGTLLGLPATAAEQIDADLPATGVSVAGKDGRPSFVLAVHVRSGRELGARLTTGADSRYTARAEPATGLTVLEPRPGKADTQVALAVLGNYLLASPSAEAIAIGGAYAARTLPKREAPKHAMAVLVRKTALGGAFAKTVREAWAGRKAELEKLDSVNRQKHGGRAPDFGDPMAALQGVNATIEGLIRILESATGGRLGIDPLPDRLEIAVELDAEQPGAAADLVAGLRVGDAEPLLALPSNVALAVLARTSPDSRTASAKSWHQGITELFGDRLPAPDRDKVKEVLEQLAAGRGDHETYGVLLDAGKGGLLYQAPVTDPKAFDSGAKGIFRLLGMKAFSEPLRQFVGDTTIKQSTATIPGIDGTVQRALLTVKPSAMRAATDKAAKTSLEPRPVEVLWFQKGGRVRGALSFDAVPGLTALVAADTEPKGTHAADERVAAAVRRVGKEAAFVVLAQPIRLGITSGAAAAPSSPVVGSFGRTGTTAWIRLEADKVALEGLVKNLAASLQ